jgi:aspartate aminotransferase-like enzyme
VAAGMILISQYFSISHFGVIQQDDIPAQISAMEQALFARHSLRDSG